jgi:hypothetical protein
MTGQAYIEVDVVEFSLTKADFDTPWLEGELRTRYFRPMTGIRIAFRLFTHQQVKHDRVVKKEVSFRHIAKLTKALPTKSFRKHK